MIEELGTRWPIDPAWRRVGVGTYRDDKGTALLSVRAQDGGLIDPERCASADVEKSLGWQLARTCNGTAMTATFSDQAQVLV